jgi:hypothetical protein
MRSAGDTGVKGADGAAYGPLQLHVHPFGAHMAPGSYVECTLDSQ